MANKLQAYAQLADHTAGQITASYQAWTAFLRTAGRLYKYPFPEQLLIYAQRPDATACAEYDFWNERMRRYVRRGSTGIAIIDNSGGKPFLRYVFDVSDTGGDEETRPWLWQYQEEHREAVSAALAQRFDAPAGDVSLPEQLEKIAVQFMEDYWYEHKQDILDIVDGSFLAEYDAYNIGAQFKSAAAVSMTYVLLSRCGLEAENYFRHEDFLNVFDFNTPDTLAELGTAVSQGSEAVLRQIEVTIKKYEREKSAERSAEHGEQADVHADGGRSDPQPDPGGAAGPGSGQVREDAPDVSEGTPSGAVQPPDAEGDAVPAPAGDRGHGQQPVGADDAGAGGSGGGDGAVEGQRPDEVGGADEQLQGPGGGNHPDGADLQLNEPNRPAQEGPSAEAPGPFSVPQAEASGQEADTPVHVPGGAPPIPATVPPREITPADIDAALQGWNGNMDSKRRVQQYMADHARDRGTAEWLKNEYGNELPAFPVTVEGAAADLPWTKVQRHLARLVKEDRFFTQAELDNFEDIDPAAIRERLERDGDAPSPFVERVMSDVERLAEQEASDAAPTVREIYEKYKPIIIDKALADEAYQNACKNSDKETALMEGEEAVKRAALSVMFPDGTTAVVGAEDFTRLYFDMADFRLRLHREIVDETYPMLSLPRREQDTFPAQAVPVPMDSPERFTIRHISVENGIFGIWDAALERFYEEGNTVLRFLDQADAERYLADILRISTRAETQAAPPDLSGQPVTREGDTLTIGSGDATHEVDITVSDGEWQEIQNAVPDSSAQPARDPLAPAYQPGDTVYLDKTAYEIYGIGLLDVDLQDPTQAYPILRSEPIERFEALLWQDSRNSYITEFLPARLERPHDYFREALTSGLLADRDKERIASWLRSGLGNTPIGNRLAEQFAGRSATIQLATGGTVDYSTSTTGMEINVHSSMVASSRYMGWALIPSVLRTLWQQELDGFTHEPIQRPAVHLEGRPAYQVGDKVTFPYGEREISGTIGWIGENSVRIDTGPYSSSNEIINRDVFEDALRQDERNAGLFTPEAPPAQEYTTETTVVYPAEPNHLPYEIVVERLKVPEQVQDQPDQAPAAGNFRITDDDLGVGTQKEKFRRNIEAINTLQGIELEGRSATPAEQEILSRYVGWGGLSDAFDPDKLGWTEEFLELQAALTPAEYASARASTLNAHYTRPTIVKAIYEAVESMGFKTGNILEPSCGIGNFFGLLPESMAASRLYGVELDSITGRIAQQLYPNANISIQGFEKSEFPDGFFDLAIGNVPFGGYKLVDRRYDKENLLIHDYFFAKTIDKVRSGGVIAFVTSNGIGGGTMDKKDRHAREYIARRCHLLGAIRLPCNASLAYAGTEAGMDIVFLQKRDVPLTRDEPLPGWVDVDTLEEHIYTRDNGEQKRGYVTMSRYFKAHPEMVLGNLEITSGPYGAQLVCQPIPGADLAQQLHEAVSHIHGEYREAEAPELDADISEQEIAAIPADPNVKNYSYAIVDGDVYYRQNSVMVKPNLTGSAKERVKGMVELRDCVRELIDLQMDEYTPDSAIQGKQAELNRLYDRFAKKYGLINDRANRLAFSADSAYYLLCALEVLDEDGRLERKADMFTKRTIKPHRAVASADTAMDALAVSIGERACIDLPFMAQLTGKTEAALTEELRGVIFKDPASGGSFLQGWQTADEYLSGNVRQKLREAKSAAERDPAYQVNVDALIAAQPKDLDASEIEVRLGATWIDKKYIQQFMYETLKTPYYLKGKIKVSYSRHTAEWAVSNKGGVSENDVAAYSTYGTHRANAYRILEDSLNLRDVRIYDTVLEADGRERRVLNAKETTLAAQKQQALRDAFKEWIFKEPQRRQALVQQYNEEMNCIRPREYDGSHIVFSGINPEIKLLPHQVNAIAHVLYGGNTLLAHEVGAGKTFEMIASAMESKRLGLCHKSIFVVPNHLTEQTAAEFMRLYPSANILVTTKRDFEKHRRKKFCARIATGDYDAVIIGHSQFEKIPISYARQERLIQEQIMEIADGLQELKHSGAEKFSVKQLERTKRNLEARLEKLQASHRKDDVVTFEQLGVDMMFVDESDNYKNLFLYTKMRNVAGLATTDAQKSSDMFAKCRYLDEITHGRGIVFATGTPISNSMTEMYTIQRYLQFDRLQEMGMGHFDCWASRFGETVTALELAPEGTGYRPRTRFARFFNLPELMSMFKEIADIKTADQLNLPTPEVEYHTIASKPTEIQKEMVKELSRRATRVHSGTVDPREDNMLKITSDGRKLGLDQRIINPVLPDEDGTKVNRCVENILQCWRDGDSQKLTQLVFCDISTPKAAPSKRAVKGGDKLDNPTLHMLENSIPLEQEKPFTIYEDIRQKLIAGGMAPEQVAFIHEANTDIQKKELFAKVCSGQVRVLLGSTFKMGAGTNVQDLLIALHDLDCPWRPRDLTQRKGRIERRGNNNKKVHVYRYVTEGTFDAYLWQTVENKQKFISQIMTSKSPMRSCEDVDEAALSYAEIKALCAGDPRIKERMELDVDVSKLKIMKAAHQSKQYELEDNLMKHFPEQIRQYQGYMEGLQADMKTLAEHPHPTIIKEILASAPVVEGQAEGTEPAAAKEVSQGFAGMVIKGTAYEDREAAGTALLEACKEIKDTEPVMIGSYRGFSMSVSVSLFKHKLALKGEMTHEADLGADIRGNLLRIDNALEKMPERLAMIKAQLDNLFAQQEAAKAEVGKPFPQEDELRQKSARLAELDSLLNIDGGHSYEERDIAECARPSVLDGLKRPAQPGPDKGTPTKHSGPEL